MEGIDDTENGGEMEVGANKQTKDVEKKNSIVDQREMILWFMKKIDRMIKMESKFEDRMIKMENRIIEYVRVVVSSITTDMQCRLDQTLESKKEESKIISVPTPGRIKTSMDTVQCDKSEDITQPCRGESFVTELQLQYGAEEIGQRQTTKFYDTNSDANGQHNPTVSTTICCEDIIGVNQLSLTTKSPGVSSVSKRARTAYTRSQLREIEQEPRNNNYLYHPRRINLATLLNLSGRQIKMSFRNWKKRRKKNQNDEEAIRISGSELLQSHVNYSSPGVDSR
jgi:hypothetical protein